MSVPSEYVIEDAVRNIDDIIVYRANHPIHGMVSIYLPDKTLSPELSRVVSRKLYQYGLQMRNTSLLNIPLTTKALEVSQNPREPYIVTQYCEHDLEELIGNGVIIKPRRMFTILSQVLEAIVNLAANGWAIDHIHPRQIKLSQLESGDISFAVIEGQSQQIEPAMQAGDKPGVAAVTVKIEPKQNSQTTAESTVQHDLNKTVTFDTDTDAVKQVRARLRNIYILGNMVYQLLFGRKYELGDEVAATNIKKLGRRWRNILDKMLNRSADCRYDTYEAMLLDSGKALNRNKRIAIGSVQFLLLLAVLAGYLAYEEYHKHKIMTSEAGQAIESFLEIVNQTQDEFPQLKKPKPQDKPIQDDSTILKPFDEIKPVSEN